MAQRNGNTNLTELLKTGPFPERTSAPNPWKRCLERCLISTSESPNCELLLTVPQSEEFV